MLLRRDATDAATQTPPPREPFEVGRVDVERGIVVAGTLEAEHAADRPSTRHRIPAEYQRAVAGVVAGPVVRSAASDRPARGGAARLDQIGVRAAVRAD